jgi:hypothetical protein
MQYEITLPADYDMGIIRDRIATRGSRTDDFPGLGVKAYLVRERGLDGSPVNQYAPFYLWATPAGMSRFLFGGPFDGICNDFGRPLVQTWQMLGVHEGEAGALPAVAATRLTRAVEPGRELPDLVEEAVKESALLASEPGVSCTAVGIDVSSWQLVHLTLWAQPAPVDVAGDRYAVLHVSDPHRHELPRGRAW